MFSVFPSIAMSHFYALFFDLNILINGIGVFQPTHQFSYLQGFRQGKVVMKQDGKLADFCLGY